MRCPTCGIESVEGAAYCHRCGQRLPTVSGEQIGLLAAETGTPEPADLINQAVAARGSQPAETELWRGGYSAKALNGAWLASGAASLALLIAGILWAGTAVAWLIVSVLMLLPWLYCVATLSYRWMSVRYLLTSQRFIHEHGILRRVHDRIELLDVDDISSEQGLLERLVGVGSIRILSHDRSDPSLILPGIERVQDVTSLFDNARLAERRRRGLHLEQI